MGDEPAVTTSHCMRNETHNIRRRRRCNHLIVMHRISRLMEQPHSRLAGGWRQNKSMGKVKLFWDDDAGLERSSRGGFWWRGWVINGFPFSRSSAAHVTSALITAEGSRSLWGLIHQSRLWAQMDRWFGECNRWLGEIPPRNPSQR